MPAWDDSYGPDDWERWLAEPPKRVDAPERTPFERDRARVVHSASLRRLAAKTQVLGPQSDDFIRNRLTHSLEVAQVARDLAHPLGVHPDLAETAALAHDLGHPPFGHTGESALARLADDIGGFEGNAQTFRILTRLEAKSHDGQRSVGLNLTRATLDACTKYPWHRTDSPKFGVYQEDSAIFDWMRAVTPAGRRCVEAQIMDIADDIAYSVHDLEDGIVSGVIELGAIQHERAAIWDTARHWFLSDASDDELDNAITTLSAVNGWPPQSYDGSRLELAALKNLTSDLIGVFCGQVQAATNAAYSHADLSRYGGSVVVPRATRAQIAALKAIAGHYMMFSDDRNAVRVRQCDIIETLYDATLRDPSQLAPELTDDYEAAESEAAARRVVIDHVASLTDASALRLVTD